jgi:hypothetical protein
MGHYYPHQETAAKDMAASRFKLLFDKPGLGKTITSVLAADTLGAQNILVSSPANIRNAWYLAFEHWQINPRPLHMHTGNPKDVSAPGVHFISHAPLSNNELAARLSSRKWDVVLIDEIHEFRSFTAARTINLLFDPLRSLKANCHALWGLTGTPIVSSALDLYPWYYAMQLGPLTELEFRERYTFIRTDYFGNIKSRGIKLLPELVDIFGPWVIRRTLDSVGVKLPPLHMPLVKLDVAQETVDDIVFSLRGITPEQVQQFVDDDNAESNAPIATVRRALGQAKVHASLDRMIQVYEGMGKRCPVVGFFYHRDVCAHISDRLTKEGYLFGVIDGRTSAAQSKKAQAKFQAGELDFLLVQEQAGGVGLTLTKSHYAAILEQPWTALALEQEAARLHRISQTQPVVVELHRAADIWIEDALSKAIARRATDSEKILQPFTRGY